MKSSPDTADCININKVQTERKHESKKILNIKVVKLNLLHKKHLNKGSKEIFDTKVTSAFPKIRVCNDGSYSKEIKTIIPEQNKAIEHIQEYYHKFSLCMDEIPNIISAKSKRKKSPKPPLLLPLSLIPNASQSKQPQCTNNVTPSTPKFNKSYTKLIVDKVSTERENLSPLNSRQICKERELTPPKSESPFPIYKRAIFGETTIILKSLFRRRSTKKTLYTENPASSSKIELQFTERKQGLSLRENTNRESLRVKVLNQPKRPETPRLEGFQRRKYFKRSNLKKSKSSKIASEGTISLRPQQVEAKKMLDKGSQQALTGL